MQYAVIRTGSHQYRVEPGRELLVEKLDVEEGQPIALTDVLMTGDGDSVAVGTPILPFTVHALVLKHEKGEKLRTIKYKRRKGYKRTMGHRQTYTRLLIEKFEQKGN